MIIHGVLDLFDVVSRGEDDGGKGFAVGNLDEGFDAVAVWEVDAGEDDIGWIQGALDEGFLAEVGGADDAVAEFFKLCDEGGCLVLIRMSDEESVGRVFGVHTR